MHEILLFLFYAKEKFGQGSIYDQQMSEYIFVTNCSFENRRHKKEEEKKLHVSKNRHHHQQCCHPFQNELASYYIIQMREKKENYTSLRLICV
jgi:hypothetical protein